MKVAGYMAVLMALVACTRAYSPIHVTVETGVPPDVVAVRDVTSAGWRGVVTAGSSTFDLVVSGPYEVIVVCRPVSDGAALDDEAVTIHARSPSDPPLVQHICPAPAGALTVAVSGTLVEPGLIYLGNAVDSSMTPSWSFSLHPEPGTYDLVLVQDDRVQDDPEAPFGLPSRIALRRDLNIDQALDLGTLDIAQESGYALVETSFSFPGLQRGEQLFADLGLDTGTTIALLPTVLTLSLDNDIPQGSWSASLAPGAALRASDRQIASVSTFFASTSEGITQGRVRSVVRDLRVGDTVSWTLPEPVGPVAFEMVGHQVTAAWSSLGDYSDVSLSFSSRVAGRPLDRSYELMLSRGYIEDVGATGATLDITGVPGLPDEWQIDPARWLDRALEVIRDLPGEPRTAWTVFEQPLPQSLGISGPGAARARSLAGRWRQHLRSR